VKVCLRGPKISGGKHGIQDRRRFDGLSCGLTLNLPPIKSLPVLNSSIICPFPFYFAYFALIPQDRNPYSDPLLRVNRSCGTSVFGLQWAKMQRISQILQFPVVIKSRRPFPLKPQFFQKINFFLSGIPAEGNIVEKLS
jgi:hypothetical protein